MAGAAWEVSMEGLLDIGMLVCFVGGPALLLRVMMRGPQRMP
jgi:hypothetical protein